jgi:hypothetical protein
MLEDTPRSGVLPLSENSSAGFDGRDPWAMPGIYSRRPPRPGFVLSERSTGKRRIADAVGRMGD